MYDWPTGDGLRGGTPHLHLTCSEGYVVVEGRGCVHTLTASGFRRTPLAPGSLVRFTPGTIQRLVNEGGLSIVVLMQNSGLPEAGDAVLTLPPRAPATPTAAPARRRGRGPAGTRRARPARSRGPGLPRTGRATEAGDPGPLAAFHRAAAELVRLRAEDWWARGQQGAVAAASAVTGHQLDALARGDSGYPGDAHVYAEQSWARGRFDMCGRLDFYRG